MSQKFDYVSDKSAIPPAPSNDNSPHGNFSVFEKGKAPSIDFQLKDGRSVFLRYAHILHGELMKEGEIEKIKLLFSTHTVAIEGYCLQEIYNHVKQDGLVSIRENDARFIPSHDESEPFITKIDVKWRKEEASD